MQENKEKRKCDNDQCIFHAFDTCYANSGYILEEKDGVIKMCTRFMRND
jgi:hypothetical protein